MGGWRWGGGVPRIGSFSVPRGFRRCRSEARAELLSPSHCRSLSIAGGTSVLGTGGTSPRMGRECLMLTPNPEVQSPGFQLRENARESQGGEAGDDGEREDPS